MTRWLLVVMVAAAAFALGWRLDYPQPKQVVLIRTKIVHPVTTTSTTQLGGVKCGQFRTDLVTAEKIGCK